MVDVTFPALGKIVFGVTQEPRPDTREDYVVVLAKDGTLWEVPKVSMRVKKAA